VTTSYIMLTGNRKLIEIRKCWGIKNLVIYFSLKVSICVVRLARI